MADYIYLLQNRLTPAQWRALEAVREAARAQNMTVFLVGGAVRDLTTGTAVRDLDFAIQGEASSVVADLEAAGGVVNGRNPVLSSIYLTMRGGVRVEIGPTLTVTYPTPGQASAETASILDDLKRRDFTANAMAISLNEGSYGLLLDPLNGIADIENRELRLVSNYGFIEQPSLLLRAARLSERLGWSLEARTQSRYETAKEENYISALAPFDRGYEVEEILREEDPTAILEHMNAEGWSDSLFPALDPAKADQTGLDNVRELAGQLEALGIHPDLSTVYFPLLTSKLKEADLGALKGLLVRPGFVQQVELMEARSKELAGQLTSKSAALPSDTWRLLFEAEPDVVLWTAFSSRSSAVQAKLKAFLREWPPMRQKLPYTLMQEMRITPDLPGYDKLLDDLFFALIDGKLSTPEATRAFLEPFSPPAPPPQVNVRRKAAKATRGRSRKVVEEVVESSPEDADEDEDDDLAEDLGGSDDHSGEKDDDDEGDDEDHSADDEPDDEEERAPVVAKKSAPVRAAENEPEPPATRSKVAEDKTRVPAAQKKAVGTSVPVKESALAKEAAPVTEKKAAEASEERAAPLKGAAKAAAPVKAASVPAKAAPAKVPSKAVAVTVVPPAKAGAKTLPAAKASVKKQAPAKAVVAKAPAKAAPKTPAKGGRGR